MVQGSSSETSEAFFEAREDPAVNDHADDEEDDAVTASSTEISSLSIKCIRDKCGECVNDERVQMLIIALISINAIMMGIGTFDFVTDDPEVDYAFEVTDLVFLILFTIELGMQFIYHGFYLFFDGWLLFDFFIIVMSWSFASVQIIRAFRIFRALRLITRIRVMKNIVVALLNVIPRMVAIGALLLLIMYIFSVMFTTLFKDMYEEQLTTADYFSRLGTSLFTLFQIMTLDGWSEICREVQYTYTWAWAPFVTFVIISAFIVVNLIIAVICDAIADLHEHEHDDKEEQQQQQSFDSKQHVDRAQDAPSVVEKQNEKPQNVRQEVEDLANQVQMLVRSQERTQNMIEYLTRQLQMSQTLSTVQSVGTVTT